MIKFKQFFQKKTKIKTKSFYLICDILGQYNLHDKAWEKHQHSFFSCTQPSFHVMKICFS